MATTWAFVDKATYLLVTRTIDGNPHSWEINKQLIELRYSEPYVFFRYSMPENLNIQKEFIVDYSLVADPTGMTKAQDLYDALLVMIRSFSNGLTVTATDFNSLGEYQNDRLIGLVDRTNFLVFTDEGSGVLIKLNDGYTFDPITGTINAPVGNYVILFY